MLGLSDQWKGPSVGVGLRELYFSSVGIQDFFFSGCSLKALAGNCCLLGSPPMSQCQLLNHPLWLEPLGKGKPGIQEATCPGRVRWPLQPPNPLPPIPSLVSGFLSVCTPQGGEGWLISDALWRRAPRPLGALRSDPRGLRVISPAHPEGNPTLEAAPLSAASSGKI